MIKCYLTKNLKIINIGFTAKVDIDISLGTSYDLDANGSSKKSMVCNFFASISRTRCLAISRITVKVIKKLEPQLQFPYLSQFSASFSVFDLKVLPIILWSCPKLKSLILDLVDRPRDNGEPKVMFSSVPPCLISSLKFAELKSPILGYEGEIELVRYFLKNSRVLEKLSLRFENHNRKKAKSVILQELLAIPRCSSTCEVVFL
ncbi:PREDICTED: F-box/FBD/LRR-repeat protein At1g51370-like [Brassica oleracea var. oleracea]|uniref:FBD domain-containing protein n=1 Tax=Brassica oleracea var. oleracea TaxID=109376 RepID=A0A0D3EAR2_BRAOL|nr:PREDICTED: F-box/FBD/LRR-repeat protein At1g51370-like [Brassica oleracea var. oleracea]